MDVVATLRIVLQRWYASVPLLVVTAGIAAALVLAQPGEYQTAAAILVVPPAAQAQNGTSVRVNPYTSGAQDVAANVLQTAMAASTARDALKASGVTGQWSVVERGQSPVLDITVTGPTAKEAEQWASAVVAEAGRTFHDLQVAVGAPEDLLLQVQVISRPAPAKPQYGSKVRIGIAVGAIGIGLSLGAAFAAEGMARRRSPGPAPSLRSAPSREGPPLDIAATRPP